MQQEKCVNLYKENITDVESCVSFVDKFVNTYDRGDVILNCCSLHEAISKVCFAPVELRKILAVYYHNHEDAFSQMFCPNLISGKVKDILEDRFYLLCWDISNEIFHQALCQTWDACVNFDEAKSMILEKRAALFILYPIQDSITVFSVLHGEKIKTGDVTTALEAIKKNFEAEIEAEIALGALEERTQTENDIGSEEYQQLMCNGLGDRDYDCFEYDEHDHLKQKIGFSKYGAPKSEDGYDKKELKYIEETYKQVVYQNNKYGEWEDQIFVSFMYNCLEPLPEEKLSRAKKDPVYNPKTDIMPVPIYVIRKCRGCENPCRIFVDNDNRAYTSWENYIQNNKIEKATMVLPKDGKYKQDEDGKVILETHLSPSCGIGKDVLKVTDVATTAIGLASTGVFIAALIPSVVVAPIVLTGAAITGAGVGVYSLFRSGQNIHDRISHSESMSFANSEARGAYINIVAGALGFAGAGATTVVSQLAARGVNIGQGARIVVNTIGVINIGASAANVTNSTYQVIDDWISEQRTPSLLTIVQLSSSILFFSHAVYNFRTAGTIIDETQANTLQNYKNSLRSNNHRKMFNKLTKETVRLSSDQRAGYSEVIKTIRNISNKDEVFAMLNRNNKFFNKEGIRFSAENGEIKLNGLTVNLLEFENIPKTDRAQFFTELSSTPQPTTSLTPVETNTNVGEILKIFKSVFGVENIINVTRYVKLVSDGYSFAELVAVMLKDFSSTIKEKVLRIFQALIDKLLVKVDINFPQLFADRFSHVSKEPFEVIFRFLFKFLNGKVEEFAIAYEEEKLIAQQSPEYNEEEFSREFKVTPENAKKMIYWFEIVVNMFISGNGRIIAVKLTELLQYVMNCIFNEIYDTCNDEERRIRRERDTNQNAFKITCKECGGYYFSKKK